jgi:hypothetical protein
LALSKESSTPPNLYLFASSDVRTVTGSNLRNILLLTDKLKVEDLEPSLEDSIMYHKIEDKDVWRVGMVKELLDMNMILDYAYTQ